MLSGACSSPAGRQRRTASPFGAALSLVLEEKVALGLAKPPPEDELPLEMLSEEALVRRAIAERAERAATEKMTLISTDPAVPWTEYTVTSALSGKTYRLSLRGARWSAALSTTLRLCSSASRDWSGRGTA